MFPSAATCHGELSEERWSLHIMMVVTLVAKLGSVLIELVLA
jgi:hypothetical protein